MRFRKISDTKIHCVISQEEMWEKGIEIDDFLEHREKTEDFLREILSEAKYELDLKDMGHFFSVQMSIMPEGDVSMVISEEKADDMEDALTEFGKKLQDFKEIMSQAKKQLEEKKGIAATSDKKADVQTDVQEEAQKEILTDMLKRPLWVKLSSIDRCIYLAKILEKKGELESAWYKYRGSYYFCLTLMQGEHQVAGIILLLSELAEEIITDDQGGDLLREHAECLLPEKAVQTMAAI